MNRLSQSGSHCAYSYALKAIATVTDIFVDYFKDNCVDYRGYELPLHFDGGFHRSRLKNIGKAVLGSLQHCYAC